MKIPHNKDNVSDDKILNFEGRHTREQVPQGAEGGRADLMSQNMISQECADGFLRATGRVRCSGNVDRRRVWSREERAGCLTLVCEVVYLGTVIASRREP